MKNNHKKAVAVLCGTMMAASAVPDRLRRRFYCRKR